MAPIFAFAEDYVAEVTVTLEGVEQTPVEYSAISEAWTAATSVGDSNNYKNTSAEIKLLADWDTSEYGVLEINEYDIVTLDLNGYDIDKKSAGGYVIAIGGGPECTGTLTLIDGAGGGAITGGSGGVYIKDYALFLMKGGTISGNSGTTYGGGVYLLSGGNASMTMTGGTITNNSATYGGGICGESEGFTMSGGTISGNSATYGGGIFVGDYGTFTMSQNATISGNSATYGGGVYVDGDGLLKMTDGTISNNTAGYYGGGVYNGGTLIMSDGKISGNTAYVYGGGVYLYEYTKFTMSSGEISGNSSTGNSGGGIYSYGATATMTGGEISGNSADNDGGGVALEENSTANMENVTITQNTAGNRGGGVYAYSSEFTATDCTITYNTIDSDNNSQGGGIYAYNTVTLTNTEVSNNVADNGGGAYINGGTFTLAGSSSVTDNTNNNSSNNNVYIKSGKKITIDDSSTTFIGSAGVTSAVAPTETDLVDVTGKNDTNYSSLFTSDNTLYRIINGDNNVVQLALSYAEDLYISLEETGTDNVYNIVLNGYIDGNAAPIEKFTSAQLKFVLSDTQKDGTTECDITSIGALTVTANTDEYIELINNGDGEYAFEMDGTNATSITDESITLGTVTVSGLGKYSLTLVTSGYDNIVNCSGDNGMMYYFIDESIDDTAIYDDPYGTLYLDDNTVPAENEIIPDSVNLTINVMFPNRVYSQTAAYTDMQVAVNNLVDTYFPDTEFDLGSDNDDVKYVTPDDGYDYYGYVIETTIAASYSTELTFTGSGYRTYTKTMTPASDAKEIEVTVWNNPMDEATHPVITVDGVEDSTTNTDITFLAGDITKSGSIGLYDLSAVTSYFGYKADDVESKPSDTYLGKDLNRDGKIDSRDIAMVLVSWGK